MNVRSGRVIASGALLLALLIVPVALPTECAGSSPALRTDVIGGNQAFPPGNLTLEANASALATWLARALALGGSSGGLVDTQSRGFFDMFNRSLSYASNVYVFSTSSMATFSLYYCVDTGEFIGFDIRFPAPRPLGEQSLESYSVSLAGALALPLSNASYVEVPGASYYEPGSNGTTEILHTSVMGKWRETSAIAEINFANQLEVVNDITLGGVTFVEGYRWFADFLSLKYTAGQIVTAASQIVNVSYGVREAPYGYLLGVTPNYENLTWSFLVELNYPEHGSYVILLDADSLVFQSLVAWIYAVPSAGPPPAVALPVLFLVLVASAALVAALALAWFGATDARWALGGVALLLPLVARIRRESVLDHFLRGRIVEYVSAHPGATFSELKRKFNVANGVMSYHLWVLSKTEFISMDREGANVRYHMVGSPGRGALLLSTFQHSVLRVVFSRRQVGLRDLAQELGSSKQRVHYNVKRLVKSGLLSISRDGHGRVVTLSAEGEDFMHMESLQKSAAEGLGITGGT